MVEAEKTGSNQPIWPLSEGNRAYLENQIWQLSFAETAELGKADPEEVKSVMGKAIDLTTLLEAVARQRPRIIHPDTDVVWVVSAPGSYSSQFPEPGTKILPGDVHKEQYKANAWVSEMYRHRVRTGVALVHEITAARVGKPVEEITNENVRKHGPWLLYNPQPDEAQQIREVLADTNLKMPPEKVFLYTDVIHSGGWSRPIYSTGDQVEGLRFPLKPRRLAIVSHAPHLARILFTLDYFKDKVRDTAVQVFPLKTPTGGELKYPEMEIRAILAYVYKYKIAGKKPVDFEV